MGCVDGYNGFLNSNGRPSYVLQAVVDDTYRIREVQGKPVGLILLWDSGLIRGYNTRSPAITPEQESFNVYLSAALTAAETAFARLKSRWAVLLKRSDLHYTFTPYVAATCYALHNFCEN
ncbi:unnamed protein product [Lota lota]